MYTGTGTVDFRSLQYIKKTVLYIKIRLFCNLKGQSHEINVWFFGLFGQKNPFIIPAEGFQLILSTFSCLILKLNSPSGTSFSLYFAYEEYRTVPYQ